MTELIRGNRKNWRRLKPDAILPPMAKLNEKAKEKDVTMPETASDDPGYLEWRDEKVRAALKYAKSHPEKRVPQSEVWKRFGLET